ncbi:hypothetical protein TREPR_3893 [Treponema primitia ZAS-2]|uniref:Uncharacterized protein n=1 Tax=Treponema primitia (strain ATCC BAA-887 / DSM 12427 / ZAS-2) TaxID=545694 RepID=F5YP05_TREPZ|nr:hypothetical protein TREPR_3893 [Treponema primitia ZAS-2]
MRFNSDRGGIKKIRIKYVKCNCILPSFEKYADKKIIKIYKNYG